MISLSTEIWETWECVFPFHWPAFGTMWVVAVVLFLTLKIALIARDPDLAFCRQLGFLCCWPGMDIRPFHRRRHATFPTVAEYWPPVICLAAGIALLALATTTQNPVATGWLGMASLILAVHYGLFHLLALALRAVGFQVKPIMGNPICVTSLGQFWGGTWNRAFTDAVHPLIVRPLARRVGINTALILAFLVSGLAHELVISVPAHAGYGGPLLYFLIQGVALIVERHLRGTQWQVTTGNAGRLYAATIVLAPAPILFHPPFLERVIHPFVHFLTKPGLLP